MKQIITFMIAAAAIFCLASTAMAASGISADEQALLDKFTGVVTEWQSVHGGNVANQYISEATNALTQVDLDAAACADLSATIDAVMSLINSNGWSTNSELWNNKDKIVSLVNQTANKYGMNISLESTTHFSDVTIQTPAGPTPGGSTRPAVNQTGADLTGTIIVIAALVAVFGAAVVVSRRRTTSL